MSPAGCESWGDSESPGVCVDGGCVSRGLGFVGGVFSGVCVCVCVQGVCVSMGYTPLPGPRGTYFSDPEADPPPPGGQKEWHTPVKTLPSHNYSCEW